MSQMLGGVESQTQPSGSPQPQHLGDIPLSPSPAWLLNPGLASELVEGVTDPQLTALLKIRKATKGV